MKIKKNILFIVLCIQISLSVQQAYSQVATSNLNSDSWSLNTSADNIINYPLLNPFGLNQPTEDIVHTKDGSSYRGRIVEEFPNDRIIIEDRAGNRHAIQWDIIERIERGVATTDTRQNIKNPTTSWALSFFLFPGIGQFYNGDSGKGAGMSLGGLLGVGMLASEDEDTIVAGAVIYLGIWVWSWIDAPRRSREINRIGEVTSLYSNQDYIAKSQEFNINPLHQIKGTTLIRYQIKF
ncbi:MAG: hypothetical protein WD097_07180 [Balneolales bacterium]